MSLWWTLSAADGAMQDHLGATLGGNMRGYNDPNETIDRVEAERAVATITELYSQFNAAGRA